MQGSSPSEVPRSSRASSCSDLVGFTALSAHFDQAIALYDPAKHVVDQREVKWNQWQNPAFGAALGHRVVHPPVLVAAQAM